jgi:hypothetical protein
LAEIVSDVLIVGEETVEMADVSGVGVPGPLGPFVGGFAAVLSRQGYEPQPVGKQVGLLAALSRWLAAEGVVVSGLSSEVAERFCAARRAAGRTGRRGYSSYCTSIPRSDFAFAASSASALRRSTKSGKPARWIDIPAA